MITGDGEMLMGLGALATIGAQKPANLAVVVLDNERYGETGMQVTHTGRGTDLAGVARSVGFKETLVVSDERGSPGSHPARPRGAPARCWSSSRSRPNPAPMALPPKDGAYLKNRFREALGLPVG